jgi:hypothetical protein
VLRVLVLIIAICLLANLSVGARITSAQSTPQKPQVVSLMLDAAPEPVPALKYEFLPRPVERKPGNAATNYYRAVLALQSIPNDVATDESKWSAEFDGAPYEKVPRDRMLRWINAHERAFEELRLGVFRESCDWGLRMQDLRGMDTLTFLIEEFQQLRWIVRPLNLKTRLAIEQRHNEEAFELLRLHYQLAKNVADQPNTMCALFGVAFISLANERVEQWIGSPGSPNLYWALATLPRPLVSLRNAIDQERALPERLFPFLADAETSTRSKEEWQRLFVDAARKLSQLASSDGTEPATTVELEVMMLGQVARVYPLAKRELIADGFDARRLEAMPVGQVVAIHLARKVRANYDTLVKGFYLPYDQALAWSTRDWARGLRQEFDAARFTGDEVLPLSRELLPMLDTMLQAEIRTERHLRALQAIEAIRLHMALHGGRLPKSLDAISVVPVPLNPATLRPFPYRLEKNRAVLIVPTTAGESTSVGREYILQAR